MDLFGWVSLIVEKIIPAEGEELVREGREWGSG
jgi:hypothetical protein